MSARPAMEPMRGSKAVGSCGSAMAARCGAPLTAKKWKPVAKALATTDAGAAAWRKMRLGAVSTTVRPWELSQAV